MTVIPRDSKMATATTSPSQKLVTPLLPPQRQCSSSASDGFLCCADQPQTVQFSIHKPPGGHVEVRMLVLMETVVGLTEGGTGAQESPSISKGLFRKTK